METFIDPKTLARVKDLPLVAKTVAEGFLHGLQTSMQRGVGIEFSQYRPYENGDQLSLVDWKLFARSDRYFVREAERESEIDIWFLLDASRSMQQKSEEVSHKSIWQKEHQQNTTQQNKTQQKNRQQNESVTSWNKLDYAKHLIASMSYIAQKQGDSIGYLGLSSDELSFLPSGNSEKHWRKLLMSLAQTNQGQYFPDINLLRNHISQLQRPSIIFVVSDFNQQENEIVDFIGKLNSSLCEVIAIQLNCNDELNYNYQGAVRFKDLETDEEVLVSASQTKAVYEENYNSYQNKLTEELARKKISCQRFNIDKPLDQILYEYLRQRQRVLR